MKRFQHTVSMSEGDDEDLRLLLIGKTGSGKSSTGNIIFNDRVFESEMSSSSVTRFCKSHTGAVNNRRVRVTDTPDFIFSTHTDFDSDSELKKALELCSPGPHVILLLLSLSTFTEQEMDFTAWFEQKFGVEALRFTVVLFTHAGQRHMRTLAEMIRMNPQLSAFINRCRGGFCEMNIKAPANSRQVTELMQKIDRLISENSNSCYTLDMMKETERRREERERREEEEKREEEERREREHQIELDRVRRETENSMRRWIEQEKQKREEEERRERERQIELDRVKIEREIRAKRELELKLKQEKAKIVENKKKAEKQLKYVNVLMFFAVMSGGVLVLNRDSSHGWMFTKGFIAGGSVRVLTGFFCRLMSKSQFICSSFHERPSAVRQIFLETAGVACGGIFAGAFLHHFKGENLLHIPVLPGAAGAFTGILTSFLSSCFYKNV